MVSTETLTTVILDALPSEKYSVIKQQAIRDPDLSVERMICLGSKCFLSLLQRERAWCSVHKKVGHDNTECYAQQKNGKSKWYFGHDDSECFVQKKNEATTDDKDFVACGKSSSENSMEKTNKSALLQMCWVEK